MALSEYQLLSRPHRVLFQGFESTTTALQQAGWRLAAEQDMYRMTIRLLMNFEPARLYLMSEANSLDFYQYRGDMPLVFRVRQATSHLQVMETGPFDFRAIDATPQMVSVSRKNIEDFGIFAAPLVRTEEILVEPSSVAECLDLIRRLQSPALAEVRERNRGREAMNQQKFHAQILSVA